MTDPEGTPGTNVGGGTGTATGTGDSSTDDSVDGSGPPSTDPVTPAAGDDGDTTGEDAFAETWFSDKGAFFDLALWALPLVLIAMAPSLVSRRLRAFWIGPLVAAAPFVVALYFFFQNVNRMLPAAF